MPDTQVTTNIEGALDQLDLKAPGVPLLALGQTIFWDEPMKAGLAQQAAKHGRLFVAGIHDTDYFAKLPRFNEQRSGFKTFPHNDTTTKGLWSAAAEFSALFGSETVISKEMLQAGGLKSAKLIKQDPHALDEATEAFGWRGIVSLGENAPITAEVNLDSLLPELIGTLRWALESSICSLEGSAREAAQAKADLLIKEFCTVAEEDGQTLAEFYAKLLPTIYSFVTGHTVDAHITRTTELLRFNRVTCSKPRFQLLNAFIDYRTRDAACEAYNLAIHGSGIFDLSKFGTGAIPFDVVIPGHGRGTLRLGSRGAVISTPKPQFLSLPKPLESVEDLATALERKFGPDCVIVGKAVTLIGMLGAEYVFVFHEGASSYVDSSRQLHQALKAQGHELHVHPLLRLRYDAWSALKDEPVGFELPQPFRRPFGAQHISSQDFAARWREVGEQQWKMLETLKGLRRPVELIEYLSIELHGEWNAKAVQFRGLQEGLQKLTFAIGEMRVDRQTLYARVKELSNERLRLEKEKGDHFRARIFNQTPSAEDVAEREGYTRQIQEIIEQIQVVKGQVKAALNQQRERVKSAEVEDVRLQRRQLEADIERGRLGLIREAVIASKGLCRANQRPSAWWFSLVSPGGTWFNSTIAGTQCYLEPLV